MKALETNWRGFRFRSRTEARWAVALTTANIPFEYEPQGFDLPSGWYLPDFWLPERKQWLEIKGEEPSDRELALARDLSSASGRYVLIAVGPPDPDNDYLTSVWGQEPLSEVMLQLPSAAYAAARAERFDGKPQTAAKPSPNSARGWRP